MVIWYSRKQYISIQNNTVYRSTSSKNGKLMTGEMSCCTATDCCRQFKILYYALASGQPGCLLAQCQTYILL